MKYLISESQVNNIQDKLIDITKKIGWNRASDMVGGRESLLFILGKTKENVINLLLSYFKDLHIKKRGSVFHLIDGGETLIQTSSWGLNTKVFDGWFKDRIDDENFLRLYVEYRRDLIKELISRYPELYSEEVDVYEKRGLYRKLDSFRLNNKEI
jgi:hypothetical protein